MAVFVTTVEDSYHSIYIIIDALLSRMPQQTHLQDETRRELYVTGRSSCTTEDYRVYMRKFLVGKVVRKVQTTTRGLMRLKA
jgi:hypothetical protein